MSNVLDMIHSTPTATIAVIRIALRRIFEEMADFCSILAPGSQLEFRAEKDKSEVL